MLSNIEDNRTKFLNFAGQLRSINSMSRYITFFFFLLITVCCRAQDAPDNYNGFSKMPSEQLITEGRKYFEQRDAGKALICFAIVIERYKEDSSPEETRLAIRAMNNCGCVYKFLYYDYTQAYNYFSTAYELCEAKQHEDLLLIILVNLGDLLNDYSSIYGSEGISQQATDLFDQCFTKGFENSEWELVTTSFFNLSNQNYELELDKYQQIFSKEIPDTTPDIGYIRLQYKALEKIQQKKYAEARTIFTQQFETVSARWQSERDTLATMMSIAKTYELEKDYANCADVLKKALLFSSSYNLTDHNASIYKQLSVCSHYLGDTIQQQHYRLAYLETM